MVNVSCIHSSIELVQCQVVQVGSLGNVHIVYLLGKFFKKLLRLQAGKCDFSSISVCAHARVHLWDTFQSFAFLEYLLNWLIQLLHHDWDVQIHILELVHEFTCVFHIPTDDRVVFVSNLDQRQWLSASEYIWSRWFGLQTNSDRLSLVYFTCICNILTRLQNLSLLTK